jgi:hypothetical protein
MGYCEDRGYAVATLLLPQRFVFNIPKITSNSFQKSK